MKTSTATRQRRRYSDEFRALSLACLDANRGNIERTARELSVPASTLDGWAKGRHNPVSPELRGIKSRELHETLDSWVRKLLQIDVNSLMGCNIAEVAVAVGIAVDKIILLEDLERRQATSSPTISPVDLSVLTLEEVLQLYEMQRKAAGLSPCDSIASNMSANATAT